MLQCAVAWQRQCGMKADPCLEKVPAQGSSVGCAAAEPALSPGSSGGLAEGSGDSFSQLQRLVDWHRLGLLSDAEFARYKQAWFP